MLLLVTVSVVFQMAVPDAAGFRLTGGLLQITTLLLALHSSDAARGIYEALGFRATNEMFYVEQVEG